MNIEAVRQSIYYKANDDFYTYRRLISPDDIIGKFYKNITKDLQDFYDDIKAGKSPELMINCPPQHGKSSAVVEFFEWVMGKEPDWANIYTSFSGRLGVRANMKIQRDLVKLNKKTKKPIYGSIFPNTKISAKNVVTISQNYKKNSELIEIIDKKGSFRNTTVGGAITGESITGFGAIDDPLKGREEANSETMRTKCWDWYQDDFRTRFSEQAGLLIIMTRWHIDDLAARAIKQGIKVKTYRALSDDEVDDKNKKALFPEFKSLDFLLKIKNGKKGKKDKVGMDSGSWESLYQQRPVIKGGNMFKQEDFNFYEVPPHLVSFTMYADTAMKDKEANDYSVFEVWGKCQKGEAYLIDLIRGKWKAPELLTNAIAFWNKHSYCNALKIEDKSSGTGLIQTLERETAMPVLGIPRSTDKVERANSVLSYQESGRVHLPKNAPFLSDFLTEVAAFPNGKHDDQVDPMLDALNDCFNGENWDYGAMY